MAVPVRQEREQWARWGPDEELQELRAHPIAGERMEKERVGLARRRVRSIGRFYDEVHLPQPLDDHGLTAKLEDGVLTVRVPKTAAKGRRVDVA
jgi:HSP20 family molecular chaperone IbpA